MVKGNEQLPYSEAEEMKCSCVVGNNQSIRRASYFFSGLISVDNKAKARSECLTFPVEPSFKGTLTLIDVASRSNSIEFKRLSFLLSSSFLEYRVP
jgi:hypothetical protein